MNRESSIGVRRELTDALDEMATNGSCPYRESSIGVSLKAALDEMVTNGSIPPHLALKVVKQFDKSISEALQTKVKSKSKIKGHLRTYNFCDNKWTFNLENATFKTDTDVQVVDRVKIEACDAKILKSPQKKPH